METNVWLQVETRARVLIKELIEPTIRRVSEANKQIDDLSQMQIAIKYRMEDMESVVSNIEKRLVVIDEFSKKVTEFEAFQSIVEGRFNRDREEIKSMVYSFGKKQVTFEEDLQILQRQRDSLKDDVISVSSVIINNKFELEEQIEQLKQKFRENTWDSQNRFEFIESNVNKLDKQLASFSSNLAQNESTATESLRLSTENIKRSKKIEKKLNEIPEKFSKELEKVRNIAIVNTSELVKVRTEVRKVQEQIKLDENGTNLKMMITEPLYLLFKDLPTLKVLAEYDKERLGLINTNLFSNTTREQAAKLKVKAQNIIDTPLPVKRHDSNDSSVKRKRKERVKNLKKQMAASIAKNTLKMQKEEPVKKSKPHPLLGKVIQDTIRSSMSSSSPPILQPLIETKPEKNFNHEVHQIKDKQSPPSIPSFLTSISTNETQSVLSTARKIENPTEKKLEPEVKFQMIPLGDKIFSSVVSEAMSQAASDNSESDSEIDNFVDFTPMINLVRDTLEQHINDIYIELRSSLGSTENNLSSLINETKSSLLKSILSIKSNHENYTENVDRKISEVEVNIQQAVYECNSASANRKRDHTDISSQIKHFLSTVDEVSRQGSSLTETLETINKTLETIIDFCRITTALQSQDESDRESIFLMGTRESKKSKIVSIDKRCLSCAGQSSSVIAAFKIACLAYEPSLVPLQEKKYSRKELISMQRSLLRSFNKSISIETSEDREVSKGVSTSRHWRPLSVPISNFSTLTSPYLRTPDTENLPFIRKSFNN